MSDRGGLGSRWKTIRTGGGGVPAYERALPERVEAGVPTVTCIGSGGRCEGTLRVQGDLRIDCEFRGDLETDGGVTVGESGSVEGDIRAREVEIRGAVVGNVVARRQLVLYAGARLHGDVETACLEVQRHAFFQGTTAMTQPHESTRSAASRDDLSSPAESAPGRDSGRGMQRAPTRQFQPAPWKALR